jgi:hypothetical protein
MQSGMFLVWIGVLLIVAGVVLGASQALRKGRLSDPHRVGPTGTGATLEPRGRVKAFSPKLHWPAVALVALGIILILTRTVTG